MEFNCRRCYNLWPHRFEVRNNGYARHAVNNWRDTRDKSGLTNAELNTYLFGNAEPPFSVSKLKMCDALRLVEKRMEAEKFSRTFHLRCGGKSSKALAFATETCSLAGVTWGSDIKIKVSYLKSADLAHKDETYEATCTRTADGM